MLRVLIATDIKVENKGNGREEDKEDMKKKEEIFEKIEKTR